MILVLVMTTADVATRFGVTRQTVLNWVDQKLLTPDQRLTNRAYLFTEEEVKRFALTRI